MGYYKEQVKKDIEKSEKEITFIGPKYVFNNPVYLILEERNKRKDYYVKGIKGGIFFKCLGNYSNSIIYMKDEPLFSIKNSSSKSKICAHDNEEKVYCTVTTKNSFVAEKYNVEYINLSTEENEILNMNADTGHRSCGIFTGREKEGAPMICKIVRYVKKNRETVYDNATYYLEISANADNLFMIMLSIIFAKRACLSQKASENSNHHTYFTK
eukprot:jgi/Orpsp1_1/1189154/evm.model.d7180000069894.1